MGFIKEVIWTTMLVALGMALMLFFLEYLGYTDLIDFSPKTSIESPQECENLSTTQETSKCLIDWVKGFYNYNITDDKITLSLEDLRKRGGDCKDWSDLYKEVGEDLGLKGTPIVFRTGEKTAHKIMLLYNNRQYCLIDQRNLVGCIKLKD